MKNTTDETSRLIVWIIFVFIGYILAFLQFYGIYRLYSIRRLIIVQKRYPQIVFFEAIICIIYLFISLPFVNKEVLHIEFFEPYSTKSIGYTYPYLAQAMVNAEGARLWLIYFDLNYLHSLKNDSWKSIINVKHKNKDWFLINKHKYGNKKWILLRVFIYYLISATISATVFSVFDAVHWARFLDGCLYGLPVIISIYVYCKCPKHCKDYFFFQYEFKLTTIAMLVTMIIYLSSQIIIYFSVYISDMMLVLISCNPSFLSLISTLWIPHKILSQNIWSDRVKNKANRNEIIMNVIQDNNSNKNQSSTNSYTNLLNTLKNQQDLELFVDHISHEFSSELILSFIEFVQYKQYFGRMYKNEIHPSSVSYDIDKSIPKSSIVYGDDENIIDFEDETQLIVHIKNSAYLLYKKYISIGCELEINISSTKRNYYYNLMDNNGLWMKNDKIDFKELIFIFDPVIDVMFFLMSQSFTRFTCK